MFWSSVGITGWFVFNLLWNMEGVTEHPFRVLVGITLACLWFIWAIIGAILGGAALAAGLED